MAEAANLREQRAIDEMRRLAQAPWCPDGVGRYTPDSIALFERVLPDAPHLSWLYPPREGWGPGWRGRLKALPFIFREQTRPAVGLASRKYGAIAGVAGAAWWIPRHLRCQFALQVDQPNVNYALLRRILEHHGHPELALADWNARTKRCFS